MFGSNPKPSSQAPLDHPTGIDPATVPVHTMKDDLAVLSGIRLDPVRTTASARTAAAGQKSNPAAPQGDAREQGAPASLPVQETSSPFLETPANQASPSPKPFPTGSQPQAAKGGQSSGIGKYVAIGALALVAASLLGGGYYFYMTRYNVPAEPEVLIPVPEVPEPVAEEPKIEKFSGEKANYLQLDVEKLSPSDIQALLAKTGTDVQADGKTVPVEFVVVDLNNNPIALKIFAKLLDIKFSANLLSNLEDDFSLFIFSDGGSIRLGLGMVPKDEARIMGQMKGEEKSLIRNLSPLFLGEEAMVGGDFQETSYRDVAVHYLNLNADNTLSVDYFVHSDRLFIVTSKNTGRAIIDKAEKGEVSVIKSDFKEISADNAAMKEPNVQATGLSIANAVVVMAQTESAGIAWEYEWLRKNSCQDNGGYVGPDGQTLRAEGGHNYDIIAAKCQDGQKIDHYFLIDNYFGKL